MLKPGKYVGLVVRQSVYAAATAVVAVVGAFWFNDADNSGLLLLM